MPLSKLVKTLSSNERQRLESASRSQAKLLSLYKTVHKDITGLFQVLFTTPSGHQLRVPDILNLIRSIPLRGQLDARIELLNREVSSSLLSDGPALMQLINSQTRRELVASDLGLENYTALDPRVLEVQFIDAIRRIQAWNYHLRPELIRDLVTATTSGHTTAQLARMVQQSIVRNGYTPPIARARAHMLANSRYAVVQAANAAREQTYLNIQVATGVEMRKMWLASITTCCRSCALLHGQISNVGTRFIWDNLGLSVLPHTGILNHPPLHPNCRCRIVLIPPNFLSSRDISALAEQRTRRLNQFRT